MQWTLGASCLCLLLSCGRPESASEATSAVVDEENPGDGRWVGVEHDGQILAAFVPRQFQATSVVEDTILLRSGARRIGVAHVFVGHDAMLYIGAFSISDPTQVHVDHAVAFENALRDGATVTRRDAVGTARYRLSFPNGDELEAEVLTVWKGPVLFIGKAVRKHGDDRPDLDRFMRSLR